MPIATDWRAFVGPLEVAKHFNVQSNERPRVVFLPERHNLSGDAQSTFLTNLDRTITKAILKQFVRPGDTICLEQPSNLKIDPTKCVELAGLKLPLNVTVRGWDDPSATARLRHLYRLKCALDDISPLEIVIDGQADEEETDCIIPHGSIVYRASLLFLRMHDFSTLGVDYGLTREMLPDHHEMDVVEYMRLLHLFMRAVEDGWSHAINHSYVSRGLALQAAIDSSNANGTTWVLGGNKHFVSYEDPLDEYPVESDHPQSIENLHEALLQRAKPAIILAPMPLDGARSIADMPPAANKLSQKIHRMAVEYFQEMAA